MLGRRTKRPRGLFRARLRETRGGRGFWTGDPPGPGRPLANAVPAVVVLLFPFFCLPLVTDRHLNMANSSSDW